MKIKGQNGIIQDVAPSVATGMIAAGMVVAVGDENAEDKPLIAAITTPDATKPVDEENAQAEQADALQPDADQAEADKEETTDADEAPVEEANPASGKGKK